jgi:MoaA/NifB/PqqE/SkfB family radical SAM enzyme
MSVRNCALPWHWMLITHEGDVMPCGHGSKPVGNLRDQTIEQIWNGQTMQEVRASVLRGDVHRVCCSLECPFQRRDNTFPEPKEPMSIQESFARAFDEDWYLATHSDVRDAVVTHRLASGLEHFIRHGRSEGRPHRLLEPRQRPPWARAFRAIADGVRMGLGRPRMAETPLTNAVLALVEYSRGATGLQARPADIVIVVSTVCNLKCVMCPHGMGLVERPRQMPLEIIERVSPFLPSTSRMIVSGLGEPMISPAFWWIIEQTRGREDVFVRANSNGHLITAERAQRLLESGLAEISFSLDAATSATYSKIRGGDLDKALAGISTLLRLRKLSKNKKMEILINMTLMRENMAEAASFVALAAQLGADGVLFSQLFPFGDRPDWQVSRKEWTFNYSEQMLVRDPVGARLHISRAKAAAEAIAMPVVYIGNVLAHLEGPTAA